MLVQLPKPSSSIWPTMLMTRPLCSTLPWGNRPRWDALAEVNSMAELFGQAATQAPQPMQAAASMAWSASTLGTGHGVAVGRVAGVGADVATSLDDAVKGAAVDHQVFHHGERPAAPGLDDQGLAVFKTPHVQLTRGGFVLGAVGLAVDDNTARATNAFATIVVKGDGLFAFFQQTLVDDVQHFQERHLGADTGGIDFLEQASLFGVLLSPNLQLEIDLLFDAHL